MTATEDIIPEIDGIFELTGDGEVTDPRAWVSELALLRAVK